MADLFLLILTVFCVIYGVAACVKDIRRKTRTRT